MEVFDATALNEVLDEVETILNTVTCTDVVWAGDLNWDSGRKSKFSKIMKEFVEKTGLVSLWDNHPIDFTHIHTDNKSISTVDHFLISPSLVPCISSCGVVHRGDNLSRHSPIWLSLSLDTPLPMKKKFSRKTPKKPSWPKSSEDDISSYQRNCMHTSCISNDCCFYLHCL